ncbi:ubiquinol-cytochrome c reductase iron-sulfur subunit [candidate division KSB1 bacterium]
MKINEGTGSTADGSDILEGSVHRSRREFMSRSMKGVYVVASGSALLALLTACGKDETTNSDGNGGPTVDIDTTLPAFSALATVGGSMTLEANAVSGLPTNGVIIVRSSETTVTVLDRTCTHQGCKVGELGGTGIASCPCHGSQFNSSGGVVRGPATRALKTYKAAITGDIIEIDI